VGLGFGGESEMEASPARRVAGSPQTAAMRFNDRAADPKSHAGAKFRYPARQWSQNNVTSRMPNQAIRYPNERRRLMRPRSGSR
jgi:hypothetical protein